MAIDLPRLGSTGINKKTTLRNLALIPVGAAVVHLAATFAAMTDTRFSAYARLSSLPANTMTPLPAITPGRQPLPFLSADARYSICRFESKNGPITVHAVLPDAGWTLGIYQSDGTSAYFATAATGKPAAISLTIIPGEDRFLGLTPQALGGVASSEAPQTVTAKKGLIVVRAPDKGPSYTTEAGQGLAGASCSQKAY